jgi:hypothetical protein
VRVDAFAVRLRPRTPFEAADLGTRLCQSAARDVYPCVLCAALPIAVLTALAAQRSMWIALVVVWWAKPWLDRTILFVLSRAAFGQRTTVPDLWKHQRQVWWRHPLHTWTLRRLSPWRSLTQPVYQLEGLSPWKAGDRVRQIRRRRAGAAWLVTAAYATVETCLSLSLIALAVLLTPSAELPTLLDIINAKFSVFFVNSIFFSYAATVLFLEPFYVAAGFAIYLGRRAELEAWDIEQEFRRAFAA